jgi:hypothetical protein
MYRGIFIIVIFLFSFVGAYLPSPITSFPDNKIEKSQLNVDDRTLNSQLTMNYPLRSESGIIEENSVDTRIPTPKEKSQVIFLVDISTKQTNFDNEFVDKTLYQSDINATNSKYILLQTFRI